MEEALKNQVIAEFEQIKYWLPEITNPHTTCDVPEIVANMIDGIDLIIEELQ